MKESLKPGLEHELRFVVPASKTVPNLYPESEEFGVMPEVFATGFFVGLIEWACIEAVNPHIDWPREQTLGTRVDVSHVAATPPGLEVAVRVRLEEVDGRRLMFEVEASDGVEVIGRGSHGRSVVDRARFDEGMARKKAEAAKTMGGRSVADDAYERLVAILEENGARYRLIDHAPEGRTEVVSPMRGNELAQAAKCMVVMVKIGKKQKRYVLAVVPGDARVDLGAVKALFGGTYVSFASREIAEGLAGSVAGTILPLSFEEELELIVDPSVLENEEIFFNAARLDRSAALNAGDYAALARPRLERIAERAAEAAGPP